MRSERKKSEGTLVACLEIWWNCAYTWNNYRATRPGAKNQTRTSASEAFVLSTLRLVRGQYWLTLLSSCESCVNVLPARSTTRLSAPRYLNMHATMANTCRSNFILPFFSLVNTLFSTMKQAPGGLNLLVYSRNVGSIFGITKLWLRGNVDSTV